MKDTTRRKKKESKEEKKRKKKEKRKKEKEPQINNHIGKITFSAELIQFFSPRRAASRRGEEERFHFVKPQKELERS